MKKLKWASPKRTVIVAFSILYIILLGNSTVQSLLGRAVGNIMLGSTTYCYQNNIQDSWWQIRR